MKFIYCPAQIRTAFSTAGLDLRILLDLERIASILSPDDVGIILHFNLDAAKVLPACIPESLTNAYIAPDQRVSEIPWDRIKSNKEAIMRALNDLSYNKSDNASIVNTKDMKVTCDLMDENTLIFSHAKLEANEVSSDTTEGLKVLLDRLIQQLVVHHPFEEVAALPLFKAFLTASQSK